MPPQPLARVRPDGEIRLGEGELSQHPQYAALVMAVIEQWANAENVLSQMVARFLNADFKVVMAMLQALKSTEGRRAALIGAAQEALSTNDFNPDWSVGWVFDRQISLIRGGTRPTAPVHDGNCGANALRATIVGNWREPSGESRFMRTRGEESVPLEDLET